MLKIKTFVHSHKSKTRKLINIILLNSNIQSINQSVVTLWYVNLKKISKM